MPLERKRSFIKRTASFRRKKTTETKVEKIKDLNEEDEAKFLEFKKSVYDELQEWHNDSVLLRFFKAKSYCAEEAAKLLRLDLNCRRILSVERILEDYEMPEVSLKFNVSGLLGCDKEGSLVRVLNLGHADFKGIIHSLSTIEQIKIFMWYMEYDARALKEANLKSGRDVDKYVYIVNMECISLNQLMYKPSLDTGLQGLKLLQEHYHDIAKVIYIVNAPSFFPTVFKLFKPALQESFQKKLKIFSTDNWREELQKSIDADLLPVYLGGTRVDCNNDPQCKALVGAGGIVPESYYSPPEDALDPEDPFVTTATVPAGSFLNFRYPVSAVGTEIFWHIQGKDNDIGIGLFLEPMSTGLETPRTQRKKKEEDMSHMEQLCPIIRSQCHITPEINKAVAWKSGIYVLHLDNTYSWMNSKQVYFKVTVRPPTVETAHHSADAINMQKLTIRANA